MREAHVSVGRDTCLHRRVCAWGVVEVPTGWPLCSVLENEEMIGREEGKRMPGTGLVVPVKSGTWQGCPCLISFCILKITSTLRFCRGKTTEKDGFK